MDQNCIYSQEGEVALAAHGNWPVSGCPNAPQPSFSSQCDVVTFLIFLHGSNMLEYEVPNTAIFSRYLWLVEHWNLQTAVQGFKVWPDDTKMHLSLCLFAVSSGYLWIYCKIVYFYRCQKPLTEIQLQTITKQPNHNRFYWMIVFSWRVCCSRTLLVNQTYSGSCHSFVLLCVNCALPPPQAAMNKHHQD